MAMKNRLIDLLNEKQTRERRRIDISTLADESDVSRQVIYNWLNDGVKAYYPDVVERLCRYFECGIEQLLVFDPPIPRREKETA